MHELAMEFAVWGQNSNSRDFFLSVPPLVMILEAVLFAFLSNPPLAVESAEDLLELGVEHC